MTANSSTESMKNTEAAAIEASNTADKPATDWREIIRSGLWTNNPALVQLLGLCPLLAVTNTFINALGLAIATLLVLVVSNLTVSLVKQWVTKEIRIPVFIMIIASFVTIIQLLMNAYTFGLYLSLGIFIPLIVTNCAIIGRAEAFASKNAPLESAVDGLMMGLGFAVVLVLLGGAREILGQGTLFDGAHLLFGDWATSMKVQVFEFEQQFLLAILPPGAFIGMGLIIAIKNVIDAKQASKKQKQNKKVERARVTHVG